LAAGHGKLKLLRRYFCSILEKGRHAHNAPLEMMPGDWTSKEPWDLFEYETSLEISKAVQDDQNYG
jgi:hypothetical protein